MDEDKQHGKMHKNVRKFSTENFSLHQAREEWGEWEKGEKNKPPITVKLQFKFRTNLKIKIWLTAYIFFKSTEVTLWGLSYPNMRSDGQAKCFFLLHSAKNKRREIWCMLENSLVRMSGVSHKQSDGLGVLSKSNTIIYNH